MKSLYWRPQKVSPRVIIAIAALSTLGLAIVEAESRVVARPHRTQQTAAAELAERCMHVIKSERLRLGHPIDSILDPTQSGMIGGERTSVTTIRGHLASKQTSINPNFAAAVVDMLVDAGVQEGDTVAVGCSGSFPALNIAVYAALETLKAKPLIIPSLGASQYGANLPELLWIDMERVLHEQNCISFRSIAASAGGREDSGLGLSDAGQRELIEAFQRNGLARIEAASREAAVDLRMRLFAEHAHGQPPKVYVNVGGGTISIGGTAGKRLYEPGLNVEPPAGATELDCVMTRFAQQGTSVIHLLNVPHLAAEYGFPSTPATLPAVGTGQVYKSVSHNRWLAAVVLAGILFCLRATILTNLWHRFQFSRFGWRNGLSPAVRDVSMSPELMV